MRSRGQSEALKVALIHVADVDRIEEAFREERTAASCFAFVLGVILGIGVGVLTTDTGLLRWPNPAPTVVALGALGSQALIGWLLSRGRSARLVDKVRSRAGYLEHIEEKRAQ